MKLLAIVIYIFTAVDCYWFVYAWLNLASDEKGTEPDGADAGALTSR